MKECLEKALQGTEIKVNMLGGMWIGQLGMQHGDKCIGAAVYKRPMLNIEKNLGGNISPCFLLLIVLCMEY